jgi:hypothetical protein
MDAAQDRTHAAAIQTRGADLGGNAASTAGDLRRRQIEREQFAQQAAGGIAVERDGSLAIDAHGFPL